MTDPISYPSGFKSSEDEGFLRWCAEFPITRIASVGPAVPGDVPPFIEFHGELPDGTFRVETIPHYWVGFAGIVSIQPRRCGLVEVRDPYIYAMERKDIRITGEDAVPSHEVISCSCCGRLRYSPRTVTDGH